MSCISPSRVPKTDCICDRRIKEQVAEAIGHFSRHIHYEFFPGSRRSLTHRSYWWWNKSSFLLFWIWVLLHDLLLLQEICYRFIQDRSLFSPPQEISYSTNLSSPFFPGALQGSSYISHTARPNNMNYAFDHDHYVLSKSEVDGLGKKNSRVKWPSHQSERRDWHAAFGVCSLGDMLPLFLREVVRDSSGPRL